MKFCFPLLFIIITFTNKAQIWHIEEKAPMPFPISNNAVAAGYMSGNPYVYSFGGIDSTKSYTGINLKSFRYDVNNDSWDTIPPLPDTLGKIAAGASTIDSIIYIIGGYHVFANSSEISSNKVHRYNINTNSYLTDGTPIPVAIDDHVQYVYKDSLIFIVTGWSNNTNVPNVQIYDPINDSWQTGTPVPNNTNYTSFGSSGVIKGDTIFYFGGAAIGWNFPAQTQLRKGAINPSNSTQITWSHIASSPQFTAYRSGALCSPNGVHWLGGSAKTYNYNGIAYNGSGGVSPLNRNLFYNGSLDTLPTSGANLPMDLRGIAEFNLTSKYIIGGMESNQKVSNRTLKLTYTTASIKKHYQPTIELYPNPCTNHITINTQGGDIIQLLITDLLGNVIKEKLFANQIDVSNMPTGMYFLKLLDSNGNWISKPFIKK